MINVPEEFSRFVDPAGEHLNNQAISLYINKKLNETESAFIESHLNECVSCYELFKEIFDEDLDLDEAKKTFELSRLDDGDKNFIIFSDVRKKIKIEITISESIFVTFSELPEVLKNRNLRIVLANTNFIVRIVNAEINKKYIVALNRNFNLESLNKIFLDGIVKHDIKPAAAKKTYRHWLWAAAGLILILIIYLFAFQNDQTGKPVIPDKEKQAETLKEPEIVTDSSEVNDELAAETENIPENKIMNKAQRKATVPTEFRDNRFLESYVKRSENSSNEINIISPENNDTIRTQILFKWTPLEGLNEYLISIVDNKNNEVWQREFIETRITFLQKLDPGLYYWKIIVKKKLYAVGKFYVK